MTEAPRSGGPRGPAQRSGDVLDGLVAKARARIASSYYDVRDAASARPAAPFAEALRRATGGALVVEVKPSSPSRGAMRRFAPGEIAGLARRLAARRVAALSVLTEPETFGGSLEALREAHEAAPSLPLLMKDFVLSERQLDAAKANGASAVLLIETLFERGVAEAEREELVGRAHARGLAVLLEANSEAQFRSCLRSKADVLGINNRDLTTLRTDLGAAPRILGAVARDAHGAPGSVAREARPVLALSGCETRADVLRMIRGGADGVLVGSTVMEASDPVAKVEELTGVTGRNGAPFVKLCGLRSAGDVDAAASADANGFVVESPRSPRNLSASEAKDLVARAGPERVLVTSSPDVDAVAALANELGVDAVQFHVDDTGRLERLRARLPRRVRLFAVVLASNPATGGPLHAASLVERGRRAAAHADVLLLDARSASGDGGTGERVDVAAARAVRDALAPFPVLLAGGLTADNVAEALRGVGPAGVDVSSGIETAPGVKSAEKMRAFLQAARAAKVTA